MRDRGFQGMDGGLCPRPPQEGVDCDILEHQAPRTLAAELKGGLENVGGQIGEAVDSLNRLSRLGPADV